jgi:N-methylhydantoinase A/oxoprolinase/acetone carboxylase beta subunit
LALEERNAGARRETAAPEALSERVCEHVVREAARVVLECALAQDPGIEAVHGRWGPLGRLLEDLVAARRFSRLVDTGLRLGTPLVAIGAPAGAYFPEVARRLGATLRVPEHAAVCNAVGAAVGVVAESCEILVNQPAFKVFRVHDPAGNRDYADAAEAIAEAKRVSRELALAAAHRAGAAEPRLETVVAERRARGGPGDDGDYLAEATVRTTARGRPAALGA